MASHWYENNFVNAIEYAEILSLAPVDEFDAGIRLASDNSLITKSFVPGLAVPMRTSRDLVAAYRTKVLADASSIEKDYLVWSEEFGFVSFNDDLWVARTFQPVFLENSRKQSPQIRLFLRKCDFPLYSDILSYPIKQEISTGGFVYSFEVAPFSVECGLCKKNLVVTL